MFTSLLYQAFGGKRYKYLATRYMCGQVVFEIYGQPENLRVKS